MLLPSSERDKTLLLTSLGVAVGVGVVDWVSTTTNDVPASASASCDTS